MARSPSGVAIGVSGDAHRVHGSPMSHVPASDGSWHCVNPLPSFTVQQSWPGEQHASAQQKKDPQDAASSSQGGIEQSPPLQYGSGPGPTHDRPHAPQLSMSFASFTQIPPQQFSKQPHSASVVQPPPVPDELLEDELDDEAAVEDVPEDVVLGATPPLPPTCSSVRAPQAAAIPAPSTIGHAALHRPAVTARPQRAGCTSTTILVTTAPAPNANAKSGRPTADTASQGASTGTIHIAPSTAGSKSSSTGAGSSSSGSHG
jgi:hypothetical protein